MKSVAAESDTPKQKSHTIGLLWSFDLVSVGLS